jgi:hypothetical protein
MRFCHRGDDRAALSSTFVPEQVPEKHLQEPAYDGA